MLRYFFRIYEKVVDTDFFETLIHSKNYFLVNLATMGLNVLVTPIITRILSREDYGIVYLYSAYVSLIVPLISLNVATSVGRFYYEDEKKINQFLGTTLILLGSIISVTFTLYLYFREKISNLLELSNLLIVLIFVNSIFNIMRSIYIQILIPQKESAKVAKINISNAYIQTALAIALILYLSKDKYLGVIYAATLTNFVFFLYFIYELIKIAKFELKKNYIKYIFNFSVPQIPYTLSAIILNQFDRIMIDRIENTESVGLYSLGYNIASLMLLISHATRTALTPDFFSFYESEQFDRIDKLTRKVWGLVLVSTLGIASLGEEILIILADPKFWDAALIIPIVAIGLLFFVMFEIYGRYIGYSKKTYFSSINLLISGAVNIYLNSIYINQFGYIAAAFTTGISYFLLFLLTWITAKYILKERTTPIFIILKPLVVFFLFVLIIYVVIQIVSNFYIAFFIKLFVILIFSVIIFRKEIIQIINSL